jgi:LCP family protein required for cell wall assembly
VKTRPPGARRRPAPALAQQQLMARISAGRKARQRRALLLVSSALSAVVLLAAASAWAVTGYVNNSLSRINAGTGGTPSSGPLNILVVGLDERTGLTRQQQLRLHVGASSGETNTDTMMLVHVSGDHRAVAVVSLPRDSWVNIPGHGMNKINSALAFGGPPLMVSTVEQLTSLVVNDYVEVDFEAFVKVIDALGGVNICLPYAVDDPDSGLDISAGLHHVDGITALEYARDRHSFPTSDLARIQDQQQLIATAITEGISSGTLTDPARLSSFLSAVSGAVKVDQGFNIVSLADELRGISPGDITFTTVPLSNPDYTAPTGESAVLWNQAAATALFTGLKNDKASAAPKTSSGAHPPAKPALSRSQVSVDVYNGTVISGLSASTGAQLAALGFQVHTSGVDWTSQDIARTLIRYPAGQKPAAQLLAQVLPGATLEQVNGLPRVQVVLGLSDHAVTAPGASSSASASPRASPPANTKTAAQAACH